MAVTLESQMQDDLADQIDVLVNVGSPNGYLLFEESDNSEVARFDFNATAFGAASSADITLADVPLVDLSAAGGLIDHFSVYDGDDLKLFEGTVTTVTVGGGDIEIDDTLTIAALAVVLLTSLVITMPAT